MLLYMYNLDCSVEVLKWSCDGKYLGVADVAGCIHIISKKDFKSIVCEKVPDDDIKNDPKMRPCFCSITFTSQEGLFVKQKLFLMEVSNANYVEPSPGNFSCHSELMNMR